jgi:hypothetical protein
MSISMPIRSPLEFVFAGHELIPFPFAEQFLHGEDLSFGMKLNGAMRRIWHRPAILNPLFWLLGKMGILVPHKAENVPTTLVVIPGQCTTYGVYHAWDRTLAFDKPIRFRTTIIYDRSIDKVVDLVGPKNFIYMVWDAKFHPPDTFTLDTNSCAFRIGKRKLWLPRWLWKFLLGTVKFSQKVDANRDDTVHIDLLITHPLFGKIFGYEGSFSVVRTDKGTAEYGMDKGKAEDLMAD